MKLGDFDFECIAMHVRCMVSSRIDMMINGTKCCATARTICEKMRIGVRCKVTVLEDSVIHVSWYRESHVTSILISLQVASCCRQINSLLYEDIDRYRAEYVFSVSYFEHFQSTIKVVSPYLKGDSRGQVYGDLIRINIPIEKLRILSI